MKQLLPKVLLSAKGRRIRIGSGSFNAGVRNA